MSKKKRSVEQSSQDSRHAGMGFNVGGSSSSSTGGLTYNPFGAKRTRLASEGTENKGHMSSSTPSTSSSSLTSPSTNDLPIRGRREHILRTIDRCQVVILISETGSGKTTQLPQFLLPKYSRRGTIGCTQPRRVACTSVANFVAKEMKQPLGELVGYKIRFQEKSSPKTKILYLTDGMAVRVASHDPKFSAYSVLIIDEAHERSIHTDLMLGLARKALDQRPDLKIVVMSATLEEQPLVDFFGKKRTEVVKVKGRAHPVKIWTTPEPEDDVLEAAMITVLQIHVDCREKGDVLVFLPGQEEIEQLAKLLGDKRKLFPADLTTDLLICPLFASMPFEQQIAVFEPVVGDVRKVVIATNIAETSITIPGIKYVVDCGKVKLKCVNPKTGVETLRSTAIDQAMARQRAGRAGREGPGHCFRLYPEEEFTKLLPHMPPEILRTDMTQVYLTLRNLNIDVETFPFLDRPSSDSLRKAAAYLRRVDAITGAKELTEFGKKLALLPLDPQFGVLLLTSPDFECVAEILTITAMLSVDSAFYSTRSDHRNELLQSLFHPLGDHLTLLSIYRAWKKSTSPTFCADYGINSYALRTTNKIRDQLKDLLQKIGVTNVTSCGDDLDKVRRCLTKACFTHMAKSEGSGYVTMISRQEARIHPFSRLFSMKPSPPLLVYNNLVTTTKNYLRICTAIEESWLIELCPKFFCGA